MTEPNDVQSSLDRMKIHMELRGLRPNTVSTFARCARRFLAHTDKAPADVTSTDVESFLLDLVRKAQPDIPVLFLDTGYHFAETIGTRDAVESVYDVNVVNVTSDAAVEGYEGWGGYGASKVSPVSGAPPFTCSVPKSTNVPPV